MGDIDKKYFIAAALAGGAYYYLSSSKKSGEWEPIAQGPRPDDPGTPFYGQEGYERPVDIRPLKP